MSDDIFDSDEEAAESEGGRQRGGLLSGLAIQILKWTTIILGAIIFVVTVVVITLNILQADEPTGVRSPTSQEYEPEMPDYDYYGGIGEIRGNTVDRDSTFIMDIQLGYDEGDARAQAELSNRTPRIKDYVRSFLSERTTEQLNPRNEPELKDQLREGINSLLTGRPVREIIFDEFQVVPF